MLTLWLIFSVTDVVTDIGNITVTFSTYVTYTAITSMKSSEIRCSFNYNYTTFLYVSATKLPYSIIF